VESTTVTVPATSARATSVGAYYTRHCWPNADPDTDDTCVTCPPPNGGGACPPVGALADESSAGPTRDGRLKPELAAPYGVLTSRSAAAPPPPPQYLSPDGLHAPAGGTSFATPHVAGAMAVMLQLHPQLDALQLRQMLIDSARVDAFTGAVPNQLYGHGKLGVLTASEALLKIVESLTVAAGGSLNWTAEPHSTSYNVYRADLPGSLPTSYGGCLASGLVAPGFTDPQNPGPAAGFLYIVTGVKDGIEGSMGFDSGGHQRPNVSPCP
jgi:subtilisin family serine protease